MNIDLATVADTSFTVTEAGYDRREVDSFLEALQVEVAAQGRQLARARAAIHELEAKVADAETHLAAPVAIAVLKERFLAEIHDLAGSVLRETAANAGAYDEAAEGAIEAKLDELEPMWSAEFDAAADDSARTGTRYQHRSAQLPHLGSGASRDVLASVAGLRSASTPKRD